MHEEIVQIARRIKVLREIPIKSGENFSENLEISLAYTDLSWKRKTDPL